MATTGTLTKMKRTCPNKNFFEKVGIDLPVFALKKESHSFFYIPGKLIDVKKNYADSVFEVFSNNKDSKCSKTAQIIIKEAEEIKKEWLLKKSQPYSPKCLTLYLSNICNCSCTYCYSLPKRDILKTLEIKQKIVDKKAVAAGTKLVIENCKKKGIPFTFVVHGGGEPSIHFDLLKELVFITKSLAKSAKIEWNGVIATNGVMPYDHLLWIAKNFSMVNLSCDGPPDIHDMQRPGINGQKTSSFVKKAALIFKNNRLPFVVRATITPLFIDRQDEIITYILKELSPDEVRFEPVYNCWSHENSYFSKDDAKKFVHNFLKAQKIADLYQIDLGISGLRLDELHSSYCETPRDVLHITPDNKITSCFFSLGSNDDHGKKREIGYYDSFLDQIILDFEKIKSLKELSYSIPTPCKDCINIYHCSRNCPEKCSIFGNAKPNQDSFFCLVQKELTNKWLCKALEPLILKENNRLENEFHYFAKKYLTKEDIKTFIKNKILLLNRFNNTHKKLPKPIWKKGYEYTGKEAWSHLKPILDKNDYKPISIYVHIPFCDSRCRFCDCYSIASKKGDKKKRQELEFTNALLNETDLWSSNVGVKKRHVTTLHFGGGTPNSVSDDIFIKIVTTIKEKFNINQNTELAIESTSSNLNHKKIEILQNLGFSRLHIGVQSLNDDIRSKLGRREKSKRVLEKISFAVKKGFIVSVDLLYGIKNQTPDLLKKEINTLIDTKIHGFSIYQLNETDKNRYFLNKNNLLEKSTPLNYLAFHEAEKLLISKGYQKNHFAHYALKEDKQLYYTMNLRDEQLLALGPTADGFFNGFHYRHGKYNDYIASLKQGLPGLEGGVKRTESDDKIYKQISMLMTGSIDIKLFNQPDIKNLLKDWVKYDLARTDAKDNSLLNLTPQGSWFIAEMIKEMENLSINRV